MQSIDLTVLSFGTDEMLFDARSAVRLRQRSYARAFRLLRCIVLSKTQHEEVQDEGLVITPASGTNRLARLLRAYRLGSSMRAVDVVTVQDPFEIGLVGILVARRLKVPLYVQLHTDPFASGFTRAHWPINHIRVLIMGMVLRRAARIRVVSERVRRELQIRYKLHAPISVLPIYVDTQRFAGSAPAPSLVGRFARFKTKLLVVSRLEEEKNVALAIRAFAEAAPLESCLIIVGEGKGRGALERNVAQWKVADRVFFEGKADPAPYYQIADLLLVPSRYEGYGLVIVEALAAGTPVLSTNVGIAGEAGAMVCDEEDFGGALAEWLRAGERRGSLRSYPYRDFGDYVGQYTREVASCARATLAA
jgi:glycosyltransferase involved in cell wall biosynthesis